MFRLFYKSLPVRVFPILVDASFSEQNVKYNVQVKTSLLYPKWYTISQYDSIVGAVECVDILELGLRVKRTGAILKSVKKGKISEGH